MWNSNLSQSLLSVRRENHRIVFRNQNYFTLRYPNSPCLSSTPLPFPPVYRRLFLPVFSLCDRTLRVDYIMSFGLSLNAGCCEIFIPSDCGFKAQSTTKLRDHIRRHTQEKKYACSHCGTLLSTSTKLEDHQHRQSISGMLPRLSEVLWVFFFCVYYISILMESSGCALLVS